MTEFEVGDIVEVLEDGAGGYYISAGALGKVVKILRPRAIRLAVGSDREEIVLAPTDLKKIIPVPTIQKTSIISFEEVQIGDVIRMVRSFTNGDKVVKEGRVTRINKLGSQIKMSSFSHAVVKDTSTMKTTIELIERPERSWLWDIKVSAVGLFGKMASTQKLVKNSEDTWTVSYLVTGLQCMGVSTEYLLSKYPELEDSKNVNWLYEGK